MKTQNLRILIVDDDFFLQNMLSEHFKAEGVRQVYSASSEKECFELLDTCDVVLLDYYLNDENGIDILKNIKSYKPNLPVIFLSGQEYVNVAIRSLKYGAFDYVEKSKLNFQRIMDVVRLSLAHNRL